MSRDGKQNGKLELTQLGSVLALVFLVLHLTLDRGDSLLVGLAVLFLVIAAIMPRILAPVNRIWQALGRAMGRVMSPLMFGLIYFAILTPLAWLQKAFGGKTLELELSRETDSYWEKPKDGSLSSDHLKRSF